MSKSNLKSLFAPPPTIINEKQFDEAGPLVQHHRENRSHGSISSLPTTTVRSWRERVSWWIRNAQLLIRFRTVALEVFAGALTYFFMTVFVVAYAATIPPRGSSVLVENLAREFARSSVLAYVTCGAGYLALTRLTFAQPIGPDLAIAPMMAQVAQAVVFSYGDFESSKTLQCDVALVILILGAVGAFASGALIAGMSRFGLLRFAEYLPFPVVAGLLAATGVGLIRAGLHLAGGLDMGLSAAAFIAIADIW
eukprot:CAMPEP_0197316144 /NCGR_PEP_ID=MMETSP0891-20130614/41244_1 /TAXON_ID=44058 ORGANISM="Aureoumbra lagunensis, Strain CCMP1510" /NCGR_SAMPLE_ID=MMETSP0891 /ASSEMBLY_ACC=CAM_ASM_000534 /LENGTH=251 /DNA_ID=CAMNT_0042805473 /DNA_START=68 /DNA_END=820 /DNA_ORIENTATION=+